MVPPLPRTRDNGHEGPASFRPIPVSVDRGFPGGLINANCRSLITFADYLREQLGDRRLHLDDNQPPELSR